MKRKLLCLGLSFVLAVSLAGCIAGPAEETEQLDFSGVKVEALRTYEEPRSSLRGFTASADGKYLYGGFIKGAPRGVYKINAQTGEDIWYYQDQGYSQPGFCKGVTVDDRGYVYVGVTIWEQEGEVQLAVLDDKTGEELSLTPISAIGKVGTGNRGVHVGDVVAVDGVGMVICDEIEQISVAVLPDRGAVGPDFGMDGVMDIPALTKSDSAEGTALVFAEDGSFYMTANLGTGNRMGKRLLSRRR